MRVPYTQTSPSGLVFFLPICFNVSMFLYLNVSLLEDLLWYDD